LRLKQNPDDLEDYLDKVEEQIQSKIDLISDAFKENKGHMEIKKDVRELKFYEQLLSESSKLMDEWL
jgi:molecular chaperone HscB